MILTFVSIFFLSFFEKLINFLVVLKKQYIFTLYFKKKYFLTKNLKQWKKKLELI